MNRKSVSAPPRRPSAKSRLWKDALAARNNVAHAYNQAVALDIVSQTKKRYYPMFAALKTTIEENWKEQEQ
ncbi:MAG: hypothetical protein HFI25_08285 [Lachnospiraceae bacterium]|nr:hypothetical protein [Lachnospiraceae bacterium]